VPAPLPKPVPAVTGQSEIVRAPKSNIPAQAVTIQIASYKKREYAQREAEKLKKKGLMPRIIIKGSFSVLYVTASANKDSAKSLLAELQKEYKGCFIRRI
jgi:cell division septation protein DedD